MKSRITMTSRSDISSKTLAIVKYVSPCSALACLALMCSSSFGGTITGEIRLADSNKSVVKKKNDFSGVVVWLEPAEQPAPHPIRRHSQMLQKDKKFEPHILAIETGTSVEFPNLDPIFHNAFSNFNGQIFDVALYPPGSSRTVRFDRAGIVRVFCNIHPSMSAIIVVVDSNHFTISDREGRYSFANISQGKYEIRFFHERATADTLAKLTQTVIVSQELETPAAITISEAGYLPVPHTNKYGRNYPPDSEKADAYSSPVK